MRLSLIVPAHNEESRIGRMLDAYLPFMAARYGNDVEVIVVVNGSTDGTARVVQGYSARFQQLRCIVEPRGVGKGGALILGFREARGELVGFVDADGSTPPAAFQDLVDRIGTADAAVASRWCQGAIVSPRQPLLRRMASRVFNLLTWLLFGLRVTDTQCGAKLMRRAALLSIMGNLGITRWAFDVDLLFQLKRTGNSIVEVPTTWHDVAGSKLQIAAASAEMLAAIIRLRLLYSPFRWIVAAYDRIIGPIKVSDGIERDHLIGHSLVLLMCAQVANVGNLIFQAAMMRMLDEPQYGTLAAMLGLFAAITIPLGALPWAVAYFTAGFLKAGQPHRVAGLMLAVTRDLAIGGAIVLLMIFICRTRLAGYLHLDGSAPLLLITLAAFLSVVGSTFVGALQGLQAFNWVAGIGAASSFVRVALAAALVAAGGTAVGSLIGHTSSMLLVTLVGVFGFRQVQGTLAGAAKRPPGFYRYSMQYVIAYAGYALLMNADLVLAKHFFSADEAGRYAVVAMVGRIILFLPQPVVMAMFPKVVSSGDISRADWHTLTKALLLAGCLLAATATMCSVFAGPVLTILSGTQSAELVPLVRLMVWGLCPLSLTFFIMNFELAQRRFAIAVPLMACAAGYLACLARWHATMQQVVVLLAIAGAVAFLASVACLPWRRVVQDKSLW
jgi:O-antigen/teichoic acid export membrane protein